MSDEAASPRTFSMNSREFYEAVCTPRERPWIPNGALPREPRVWEGQVIVEPWWESKKRQKAPHS